MKLLNPKLTTESYVAVGLFCTASAYMFYCKQFNAYWLALGVAMILYAVTEGNVLVSLLSAAIVGVAAAYYSRPMEKFDDTYDTSDEGFDNQEGIVSGPSAEGFDSEEENVEGFENEEEGNEVEGFENDEEGNEVEGFTNVEGFANASDDSTDDNDNFENEEETKKPAKKAAKKANKKKVAPPPDNGERAEFLTLGKKYKIPSEGDDAEFHLDAGTTFMNAYKSLKPDQLAAMTKDTQDLMQTQKQLMGTLQTLKPLITDGKEMMDMFQSYFGSGGLNAGLGGAEKK